MQHAQIRPLEDLQNHHRETANIKEYIINALDEAEERAKDPNTKWYSHDEFWKKIRAGRSQGNV